MKLMVHNPETHAVLGVILSSPELVRRVSPHAVLPGAWLEVSALEMRLQLAMFSMVGHRQHSTGAGPEEERSERR